MVKPIIEIIKELDKETPIYVDVFDSKGVGYVDALLTLSKEGVINHELVDGSTLSITLNEDFHFDILDAGNDKRPLAEEFDSYDKVVDYIEQSHYVTNAQKYKISFIESVRGRFGDVEHNDQLDLIIRLYNVEQKADEREVEYDIEHVFTCIEE